MQDSEWKPPAALAFKLNPFRAERLFLMVSCLLGDGFSQSDPEKNKCSKLNWNLTLTKLTALSNQLSSLVKLTACRGWRSCVIPIKHQKRNFSHFSQIIFSPSIFQRFVRVCHVYLVGKFIIAEFKNLHAFSSPVLDVWPHGGQGVALDVEDLAMSPNVGRYPTVRATLAMPCHGTMPCCDLKSSDFYKMWNLLELRIQSIWRT